MSCTGIPRNMLILALACSIFGCEQHPSNHRTVVKVGIFYGGQIQNRLEWPLILDTTRQTQGFRIEFASPLTKPARVHWDVTRPKLRHKRRETSHDETGPSSFDATIPSGSERFDQVIAFEDTDRVGDWKLTVSVDGATVWDRIIHIIPKPTSTPDD